MRPVSVLCQLGYARMFHSSAFCQPRQLKTMLAVSVLCQNYSPSFIISPACLLERMFHASSFRHPACSFSKRELHVVPPRLPKKMLQACEPRLFQNTSRFSAAPARLLKDASCFSILPPRRLKLMLDASVCCQPACSR